MVSWHVLACLIDGLLRPAMFWHVRCQRMLLVLRHWICVMFAQTLLTGGFAMFLPCLLKHFWQAVLHVLTCFGLSSENASGGTLPCFSLCSGGTVAGGILTCLGMCCLPLYNVSWRGCVWIMIFCTVLCERCQVQWREAHQSCDQKNASAKKEKLVLVFQLFSNRHFATTANTSWGKWRSKNRGCMTASTNILLASLSQGKLKSMFSNSPWIQKNPYLTTLTRHVMVGITRSKVILRCVRCCFIVAHNIQLTWNDFFLILLQLTEGRPLWQRRRWAHANSDKKNPFTSGR